MLVYLLACFCYSNAQQVTSLPTLRINTENGAPINSKEDYVQAKLTIESNDLSENMVSTPIGIRGRGNSTWGMAKKPYRIKFDSKTKLLNMEAKAKNWVLLANYADKTLIRNAVALEISRFVGIEYTPPVRFIDVILNGEYLGNYTATDQIEVGKGRVPVEEQETTTTTEPDLTGGYLIELDGFAAAEPVWFQTEQGIKVTVKYPKDDEINKEQRQYITNYTQAFENALFSDSFTDPEKGYRAYVNEASLVNWYIACELTGNSDSFWSTYMYKKRTDKQFHFGPMWDFDIAFNNDNRLGNATQKLMRLDAHDPKIWIRKIWEDKWFRHAVNVRWKELLASGIQQHILDYTTRTAALIDASQKKNFQKWPILNKTVYLEYMLFNTYTEGVDYLKRYIQERVNFLTSSFENEDASTEPLPFVAEDFYYYIMNRATTNVVDVTNQSTAQYASLMLWSLNSDHVAQQWTIQTTKDKHFILINRLSGLAIQGNNGTGNNLIQATPDATNKSQLWKITPVANGIYGLTNVKSGYSMDNSGGSFENGNKVIEWNSDIKGNSNQQWYLQKVEKIPTGIQSPASNQRLTCYPGVATDKITLTLPGNQESIRVELYSITGRKVQSEVVSGQNAVLNVSRLHPGVYIVKIADKPYYTKFIKR